ncbi:MAG: glucose-6-phosphate dehydrogenase [Ostreibacterium sp.]
MTNLFEKPQEQPMFDLLFFGGTGDLAIRKLLPSLFMAHMAGTLHPEGRIWGLSREKLSTGDFLERLSDEVRPDSKVSDASDKEWESFCKRVRYLRVDVTDIADFKTLKKQLLQEQVKGDIIAYLAITPKLFEPACKHLSQIGLNSANVRVVLEKPLGTDLVSSEAINDAVAQYFTENQIYRIDHYLGKESVQNLLILRFANVLFEPLWRSEWIDNVQITIAESLGVEERGAFYEHIGALRDMVQNHLLQLLCTVAMEPPVAMDADSIRTEKLKILKALRPLSNDDVRHQTVRGQYKSGAINGKVVASYPDEPNVLVNSETETFVAIKATIDNWRWANVPFYLRTGKRMQEKLAEIVVTFKDLPHHIFPQSDTPSVNRLVFHLQPDDSIRLYIQAKKIGNSMEIQPTYLDLNFQEMLKGRRTSAYERLLQDVIESRLTLFVHRDEQVAAWRWVEPIMHAWKAGSVPLRHYSAGTWGPVQSNALLAKNSHVWHEEL